MTRRIGQSQRIDAVELDEASEHPPVTCHARGCCVREANAPVLPRRPEQLAQDAKKVSDEELHPRAKRRVGSRHDLFTQDDEVANVLDPYGEDFAVQAQVNVSSALRAVVSSRTTRLNGPRLDSQRVDANLDAALAR
jgi:hypothetical protein